MQSADTRREVTTGRGLAGAAVSVLAFGFGPVLVKLASLPGLTLSLYRLWLGFAAMYAAQLVVRGPLKMRAVRASLPGGVLFGLNVAVFFSALKETGVADATLISSLSPALVFVVAGRWFGEKVGLREIVWTALSFAGMAVVVISSAGSPVWSLWGDVLAVGALLTWTAYFLVTKRVREEVDALEYMVSVMLIAAIVVTPMALLSGQPLGGVEARDWLWLALFVLVPGAGGHVLMSWAHRYVDVSVSSVMIVGVPVVASVASVPILDEPLTIGQMLGGALAVVAIAALVLHRPVEVETAEP